MNRYNEHGFEYTKMSPGLSNWINERYFGSSENTSMQQSSVEHIDGQKGGLPEDIEVEQDEYAVRSVNEVNESLVTDRRLRDMRAFKTVLVDYLKDLIKPYWNDGRISKDVYKIIARKSAEKIIESFGETTAFPTDRRIDAYLGSSHSKIAKLVDDYVIKYQRTS